MKNSGKNSRRSNLLFYLSLFVLTLLLTLGGVYLYYNIEDRELEQTLTYIKEANAQYEQKSNDAIVSINERNIQDKEYITKKLRHDTNLKPKIRKKFKELLKEIVTIENIDQETLENKTKEERKEIIRQVLTTQLKLNLFRSALKKKGIEITDETNYLKEQEEWLEKFYPSSGKSEEEIEVIAELDKFLQHFWKKFIKEKGLTFPKIVQLVKDETGKYYKPDEPSSTKIAQEINALKSRHPPHIANELDKKMIPNFVGFKGWIEDKDKEKGTTTAGLTTTYNSMTLTINNAEPKFEIKTSCDIKIELHKAFPFSRKGKEYNLWLTKNDDKNISSFFIGWNNLIETIAHELAHAVINSTKVYYRNAEKEEEDGEVRKEGGHGKLHHQYTKELYEMIKEDAKYRELKVFWFKK